LPFILAIDVLPLPKLRVSQNASSTLEDKAKKTI